ncbi:hypothetical protein LTR53_015778 [Teratosphaeriaceae sp. CCFEE 6253]|nr:hypothetical protein LTR53_015778 [Teratosphaeriaceae sp. CCFEE 6253]
MRLLTLALSPLLGLAASAQLSYDFIVVGGGTAGIAVATRVSQGLPNSSILIIEAGPDGRNNSNIYIPGHKGVLGTVYDWNFTTTPQPGANNRVITQNRGRVLGGSSALNLLSWDRATVADYDAWEELGSKGWNWASMHPAMEKQEIFQRTSVNGSAGIVGVGDAGPIHVLVNRFNVPQQEAFFPTMQNLGLSQTFSFLNGDMLGWMRHTSNIFNNNYTRSYAPTFLAYAGANLHLLLNTTVAKINLDSKATCATGITLQDGTVITANKEVILSAGSLQSPQLLELSGIGNATILAAAGVKQLVNLPGVGENLQDHVRITTAYRLKPNYTSPDILRLNATYAAEQLALWQRNITSWYDETSIGYTYMTWQQALGSAGSANFTALGKAAAVATNPIDQKKLEYLTTPAKRVPELEVLFSDGYLGVKGYPVNTSALYGSQFMTFIASIQHPFARGSTHLNATTPAGKPVFNPNYLSNAYDLQAVAQAAKYMRRIAQTPPMSYAWIDEYEPGLDVVKTDADWIAYAKANVLTIWHPLGTCALLPKKSGGVVSPELKVYGLPNLRVVDASVIPLNPSGHIQTAVYGIAERAAEMIVAQWA